MKLLPDYRAVDFFAFSGAVIFHKKSGATQAIAEYPMRALTDSNLAPHGPDAADPP